MGRNNKARRAAKKRKKAQRRGPKGWYRPPVMVVDEETGEPVDLDESPIEYVYYDEPDFLARCPSCDQVNGMPIHSMAFTKEFIAEHGKPDAVDDIGSSCPNCGELVKTPPRVETGPDGRTLYTIDRETLLAAGVPEWHSDVWGMTLSKDGNRFQISAASGTHDVLVVCDDCGLPFIAGVANSAITMSNDNPMDINLMVGPCEHCHEGVGRPLVSSVTEGGFTTVSTSQDFASNVLAVLAEELRSGRIDLDAAATELRKHGGAPHRMLADWIEARPANTVIASAVLSTLLPLLVNQVPAIIDQGGDTTQQEQPRPAPGSYTEDEVADIVEKVLDHYDRTHGLKEQPAKPHKDPRRNARGKR